MCKTCMKAGFAVLALAVLAAWSHGSSNNFLLDGSSVILTTASGDQLAGN